MMCDQNIDFLFLYSFADMFSRSAILAAEKKNIYAGSILHGTGLDMIRPNVPDKFRYFVSGLMYKDKLESLGVRPDQVKITGALFLSEVYNYKIDLKKHNQVLFLTTPFVEYNIKSKKEYLLIIQKIFLIFKKFRSIKFVVKPHPNERFVREYSVLIKKHGLKNVVLKNPKSKSGLYTLINESDFLIGFGSTANFEALILKKPSLVIDLFKGKYSHNYQPIIQQPDSFVIMSDLKFLERTLNSAFSSNSFFKSYLINGQKLVKRELAYNDAKSPNRIFSEIRKVM